MVEDVESIRTARPGKDLVLSLDLRIQYLAYRELKRALIENQARAGSLVVPRHRERRGAGDGQSTRFQSQRS